MNRKLENIRDRVEEILDESDPERQAALSRRLRAEIRDVLTSEEKDRLRRAGVDIEALMRLLRIVE